ncbi:MAG: hypothetical protein ABJ246_18165 [Paracoccaceae bacterium]
MYTPISGKAQDAPTESEARTLIRDAIDTVDETFVSKARTRSYNKRAQLPSLLDEEAERGASEKHSKSLPTQAKAVSAHFGRGLSRIRRKHVWWGASLATAYWRPFLFLGIVCSILFLIALAFLLIGAERIWKGVILAIREIESRNPHKAHRMRVKIQTFSDRWNGMLDRCPDGWVDGFYMPDLRALETQDLDHATTVAERLRRLPDQV